MADRHLATAATIQACGTGDYSMVGTSGELSSPFYTNRTDPWIVGDQFVIRRTIELLRQCFADVVVVSNQLEKFRDYDIVVTADEFPGCGPLAGIHAAMGIVSQPYVFVIACDMPFVQGPVIEYLVRRLTEQDALIPCWEDDIEPLHGLYATRLRPQIEDALRGGVTAIRSFLPTIRTEFVTESEMQGVPGAYESFLNINTPEDAAKFDLRLGAVLDERR